MSPPRIPPAVKRIFTETFAARDIAEPLASFDAATPAADVRDFMHAHGLEAVGVRELGRLVAYVERDRLREGACGESRRGFAEAAVLDDTEPLLGVLRRLHATPFAFVTVLGQVGGIVTRADLQKAPVRMWLFGVVTLIEMRFSELIEGHCQAEGWKEFLSPARVQKAEAQLADRRRRGQPGGLVDCLQFSDKGNIVARNEEVRALTVFASRRQAETAVKRLERLRNHLAHAEDIPGEDWETVAQLCEFITQN
jgi:hypothetical protein